ncbi:MAG TPA: hypothetical protein DCS07_07665 [Bdellovibrionales bacterium]|nr:MAG: hypothetical protein A2Z97_12925 [Bdellovibrionales bacterium GWB1_52_6]OFZ05737.1 MAG: hypothetical protein A2X97_03480 [Bdellovibrionales bacterium GWA1_52_35]OFZ35573.1 MAG: hypothetical protein A2070_09635 [Bdellovibrionales bacterium GWC1_52_8]HAR42495.1 hypothetical protein [Bdellovibrionales bacterium]HCM40323.1 hypothetical protein [Bdellovibrionales bacterium]
MIEQNDLSKKNRRNSIRFKPDEGTYALIDPKPDFSAEFEPTTPALVFSESHKGCGLVILMTSKLLVGEIIRVQVGNLPVFRAEVRWREQVDSQIIKVGLLFLD